MNQTIEAVLNTPILIKSSRTGRKMIETDRVWVDFWDGYLGDNKYGRPETMAFPIVDTGVVAYWHVLGEWHNDSPDWPSYLDELGAYVPGNYGDLEVIEYD